MGAGCQQWNGRECGLVDQLLDDYESQIGLAVAPDPLPECSIRGECRWFLQRGGRCCAVCEVLLTDVNLTEEELPPEVLRRRATYASAMEMSL
jgi:hypothetical protein